MKILDDILDGYQNEMVESLQLLLRIKSEYAEDESGTPFGEGIDKAFSYMLDLGQAKSFECIDYDRYAGEIIFGTGSESVGVVTHMDVVPAGDGWDYDPYGGVIDKGKIFGRGAIDNKGPSIAAFYACLAIKESKLPLKRKIKHIIGTNEESGKFRCIEHYKKHAEVPEHGICPDGWFPAGFAEKDFFSFYLTSSGDCRGGRDVRLRSVTGGEAINIVAPSAKAQLQVSDKAMEQVKSKLEAFEDKNGCEIHIDYNGNNITIEVQGLSAHASTPELGKNAIATLINLLAEITFDNELLNNNLKGLSQLIGKDSTGEGLGIKCEDETGILTNTAGLLSFGDGRIKIANNVRSPISFPVEDLINTVKKSAEKIHTTFSLINYLPHFYVEPSDEYVVLLKEVYQEYTGDMESQPIAYGGGSYARILDNKFIPFGPVMQDEVVLFHKPNECISCERLLLLSKIYAEALYRLANL